MLLDAVLKKNINWDVFLTWNVFAEKGDSYRFSEQMMFRPTWQKVQFEFTCCIHAVK